MIHPRSIPHRTQGEHPANRMSHTIATHLSSASHPSSPRFRKRTVHYVRTERYSCVCVCTVHCVLVVYRRLPTETASAFIPFLDGKRQCAGRFLAELEFVSVLHVMLRTLDLELDDPSYDPALKPDVYPILQAPMMMRIKRRRR
jgi:cytochrome P450